MIFVILGISVLVASFLIALVSLIREQGKLIDEVKRNEVEGTSEQKIKKKTVLGQVKPGRPGVLLSQQGLVVPDTKPAINRPLFPWEEGKYQPAGDITDADREKVEMLRAQLAELKSRIPLKSQGEDIAPVAKFKDEPTEDQVQSKLSGEISVADLKRQ